MREKLNENPVAQIAVVAVLLIVVGIFLMKGLGGGESEEVAETPPPPVETSPEAGTLEGSAPAAAAASVVPPGDRSLPDDIEAAYEHGETIVLLIFRSGGIDDRLVSEAASVLDEMPNVAFFTAPAKKIARYTPITGPLGVNQAPALIVLRSSNLNDGEAAPGTVAYGYLSGAEIRQAVVDSGYRGPKLTYAPN